MIPNINIERHVVMSAAARFVFEWAFYFGHLDPMSVPNKMTLYPKEDIRWSETSKVNKLALSMIDACAMLRNKWETWLPDEPGLSLCHRIMLGEGHELILGAMENGTDVTLNISARDTRMSTEPYFCVSFVVDGDDAKPKLIFQLREEVAPIGRSLIMNGHPLRQFFDEAKIDFTPWYSQTDAANCLRNYSHKSSGK